MSLYWFYSAYIWKSRKEEKRSRRWEKWGEKAEALWLALGKHSGSAGGGGGEWTTGWEPGALRLENRPDWFFCSWRYEQVTISVWTGAYCEIDFITDWFPLAAWLKWIPWGAILILTQCPNPALMASPSTCPPGHTPPTQSFISSELVLTGKVSINKEGCRVLAKQPQLQVGFQDQVSGRSKGWLAEGWLAPLLCSAVGCRFKTQGLSLKNKQTKFLKPLEVV